MGTTLFASCINVVLAFDLLGDKFEAWLYLQYSLGGKKLGKSLYAGVLTPQNLTKKPWSRDQRDIDYKPWKSPWASFGKRNLLWDVFYAGNVLSLSPPPPAFCITSSFHCSGLGWQPIGGLECGNMFRTTTLLSPPSFCCLLCSEHLKAICVLHPFGREWVCISCSHSLAMMRLLTF